MSRISNSVKGLFLFIRTCVPSVLSTIALYLLFKLKMKPGLRGNRYVIRLCWLISNQHRSCLPQAISTAACRIAMDEGEMNDYHDGREENENDATVDLIYPFNQNPNGGGTPSIDVDPEGPLHIDGNQLSLATTVPLSVNNNSLKLMLDSEAFALKQVDQSLTLKIIPPFRKTQSGLQLIVDNQSLEIQNMQLQVKLDPNGGLVKTENGIALASNIQIDYV